MIKLTKQETPDRELLIRLDGQLTAESLIDLRGVLDPAPSSTKTTVDLSGLTSVDPDGRAFLIRLRDAGVRLQGGSLYIKRLLQEVQP